MVSPPPSLARRWAPELAAGLTALGCALTVVWPALGEPSVLGVPENDLYGTLWFRWQLLESLGAWVSPATTGLMAFPVGVDLFVRNGCNLLDALLSLPLVLILGHHAAHDAWSVVVVWANFAGFWWLSRRFCDRSMAHTVAALVGAVLCAMSPFVMEELNEGRPTQALLLFLLLTLGFGLRLDRHPRAAVGAGLCLALTGLTYWYAAIWGGALLVCVGLAVHTRRTVAALGLALLLVSPMLVFLALRVGGAEPIPGLSPGLSPPLEDVVVAVGFDGTAKAPLLEDGPPSMFRMIWWEAVVGGLALAWMALRGGWVWRGVAIGGLLAGGLALGPTPGGLRSPLYSAFLWLGGPLAERLWFPDRALAVVAMVLALAITGALCRIPRPRVATGLGLGGLTLWLCSLPAAGLLPLDTYTPPSSTALEWLAAQPPGAVLKVPNTPVNADWLVAQISHGKPVQSQMGEGNAALLSAALVDWRAAHPVVAGLEARGWGQPARATRSELTALRAQGFGYVLFDRGLAQAELSPADFQRAELLLQESLGAPGIGDARYRAWPLPGAPPGGTP